MTKKNDVEYLRTEYKPSRLVPVRPVVHDFAIQKTEKGIPIIVPVLDESGVRYVAELAKERIQHKYDCVIMYSGSRGTGKSTLCQDIALTIDPNMSIEAIKWQYHDWKDAIQKSASADPANGFYPQLVLDEAGFDLYSKEWMMVLQRDASKILQLIRVKGLILHLIMPHKDDLIKDIRDGMGYMWLNTDPRKEFGMERGYAEIRIGMINKFHRAEYWDPRAGFWFPEQTGSFWDEYSTRKIKFVNEALSKRTEVAESPIRERYDRVVKYAHRRGITEDELARAIGVTQQAISKVINKEATS